MTGSPILDESWPAVPATVPRARHAVLDHLKAAATADPPLLDIGLAVSEAVSNAVNHAYRERDVGAVRVRVEIGEDEIEVVVQDQGGGMAPRTDSPGLGLGLPTIASLADRFEVGLPERGGTRLSLWFDVGDRAGVR